MKHELPKLKYSYTDLEPYIDAITMEIHYSKHHQGYVNKLNTALEKYPEFLEKSVEDLLKDLNSLPQDIQIAVKNNGGGHYNHTLFWEQLTPNETQISDTLMQKIMDSFESFDSFKEQLTSTSLTRFGSGWGWLVSDGSKLSVMSTPNQDSPISTGMAVLLGIDVWEHAYYLKYQNKRGEYIDNFWNIVDWNVVESRL